MTGSGKSTLAVRLAEKTGLPYVAVDELTWEPGWKYVDFDDQRTLFRQICSGEQWILDNAYGHWLEIPLERVELIVALDFPRWVTFRRLFRRTIGRIRSKTPVCNGNIETLWRALGWESILLWHFRSFKRKRRRIHKWVEEGRNMVVLRSDTEVEAWLASVNGPVSL